MDRRGFLRAGALASLATAAGGDAAAATIHRPGFLSARPHLRPDGSLRLNANENPLGLSQAAREAVVEAIDVANRYPDNWERELFPRIAAKVGVKPENVFTGHGSTEVLQVAVQALAGPNVPLVLADPTFEDVVKYQNPHAYEMHKVPLDFRYAHDIGRMREVAERVRRPSVVYICNPNNPTATLTPSSEIDSWIQDAPESVFFIIDEAYFELVQEPGYWSAIKWINDRPNVLVARTFSKIYGMAGLRIGYGIAHPDTVLRMKEFSGSNSRNILGIAAALASIDDEEHIARSLQVNKASKEIAQKALDDLGLGHLPSHTNFLMHQIGGDLPGYIRRFREQGISVGRPFPPMTDYNRVSLGLPEDMERWAETLRSFRAQGWV